MICDACNLREATFHSIRSINGAVKEVYLCASCKAKGYPPQGGQGASFGVLKDVFAKFPGFSPALQPPVRREIRKCDACGITIDLVIKSGFMGCASCYTAFGDIITPMINKVQNASVHTGKTPYGTAAKFSIAIELEKLRKELQLAVSEENFDLASAIKQKIVALEQRK